MHLTCLVHCISRLHLTYLTQPILDTLPARTVALWLLRRAKNVTLLPAAHYLLESSRLAELSVDRCNCQVEVCG